MDVGEGREQAVPAHPALTAFVHPCTAGAEASRLDQSIPASLSMGEGFAINELQSAAGFPFPQTPIPWTYSEAP